MIRVQKSGLKVNGKVIGLENYLLNEIDRPLPKPPTHYVVADVINTDLSIKRITVYFNPADTWADCDCFENNSPKGVGKLIGSGLQFLNTDPNTLAYKYWITEIATNKVIHKGSTYSLTKCDY